MEAIEINRLKTLRVGWISIKAWIVRVHVAGEYLDDGKMK